MANGIPIQSLPNATTPLSGSDVIIVQQNGITKKSTITAGQAAAQSTANTALSTANSKLSSVTRDRTLTGDGTAGSPLGVAVTQKKYRGYLNVSLGPPPSSPIIISFSPIGANTVGNIVWTTPGAGTLVGTLSSAFPATKFFGIVGNNLYNGYITYLQRTSDNTIEIGINDYDGNPVNISFGINIPIDITVEI